MLWIRNLTVKGSFTTRTGPIWNEDSDILQDEGTGRLGHKKINQDQSIKNKTT